MKEIKFPNKTNYWSCHNTDGSVLHIGQTEPDQVTSTGLIILEADENQLLITGLPNSERVDFAIKTVKEANTEAPVIEIEDFPRTSNSDADVDELVNVQNKVLILIYPEE